MAPDHTSGVTVLRIYKPFVLVCIFVPLAFSAAHCAPPAEPAAPTTTAPQPLDAATLAQDLALLVRLANVEFTEAQLDKLLALYKAALAAQPAVLDTRAAARTARRASLDLTEQEVKTLTSIRERLIAGGMVSPHELQVGMRMVGGKRAGSYLSVGLSNANILSQIPTILTPDQIAELVRPRKSRVKARKQPGPIVEPILARIVKLREADDDHWAAGVEEIATSGAAQAGEPDSDAYKQTHENLMECFGHIRKMDDKQFAEGQKEILENLRALFPEDYDPSVDVAVGARQTRQALTVVFLSTRTPVLLQEMKLAHAGK